MCPLFLLDDLPQRLVPLGRGRQSNPVYSGYPDEPGSRTIVKHLSQIVDREDILSVRVVHSEKHGYFLAAQISLGWINIWNGVDLGFPGTLYCYADMLGSNNDASPQGSNEAVNHGGSLTFEQQECAICLATLSLPTNALLCGHTFHADCLRQWIQEKITCPICRHDSWSTALRLCGCSGNCKLAWFLDGWVCPSYYRRQ